MEEEFISYAQEKRKETIDKIVEEIKELKADLKAMNSTPARAVVQNMCRCKEIKLERLLKEYKSRE